MKTKLYKLMARAGVLCAIVLATAFVSVQAQSLNYRIRVSIPFDFSIAGKKLPAGSYSIGRLNQNSDNTVLSILDGSGHTKDVHFSIPVQSLDAKNQATPGIAKASIADTRKAPTGTSTAVSSARKISRAGAAAGSRTMR